MIGLVVKVGEATFVVLAVLALVLTGSLLALYLFDSRVFDQHGVRIPGPSHYFWNRHFFSLVWLSPGSWQLSSLIANELLRQQGDGDILAYNSITGKATVIIGHPDLAKIVLSGHHLKYLKDERSRVLTDLFGNSLATCDEMKALVIRKLFDPLFKSSGLRDMVDVFNVHSSRLMRHWQYKIDDRVLRSVTADPFRCYLDMDFKNLMIGVMCDAGFGLDFFTVEDSKTLSDDFEAVALEYSLRMTDPTSWWHRWNSWRRKTTLSAIANLRNVIDREIDRRLDIMNSAARAVDDDDMFAPRPHSLGEDEHCDEQRRDLLGILLHTNQSLPKHQQMSSVDIRNQVLAFMILGFESTAAALMWLFHELSLQPDIQARCQAEVDDCLAVHGRRSTTVLFDDIARFPELIQVLKETLRLHPPQTTITRVCAAPCVVGKYTLNVGTRVCVSLSSVHRHPDFWYLPNQFYPARFCPEAVHETLVHPCQYVPFGLGARHCLGQRFAQMAVICIAASLLSKYSFHFVHKDADKVCVEESLFNCPSNVRVAVTERLCDR